METTLFLWGTARPPRPGRGTRGPPRYHQVTLRAEEVCWLNMQAAAAHLTLKAYLCAALGYLRRTFPDLLVPRALDELERITREAELEEARGRAGQWPPVAWPEPGVTVRLSHAMQRWLEALPDPDQQAVLWAWAELLRMIADAELTAAAWCRPGVQHEPCALLVHLVQLAAIRDERELAATAVYP